MATKTQQIFLDLKTKIDKLNKKIDKLEIEKENNEQKIKQNSILEETAITRLYKIVKQDDKNNEEKMKQLIKDTAAELTKSLEKHAKDLMVATQVQMDLNSTLKDNKLKKELNNNINTRGKLTDSNLDMQDLKIDSLTTNQGINNDTLKNLILDGQEQIDTRIDQSDRSYKKMNDLLKNQLKVLEDEITNMHQLIDDVIATKKTTEVEEKTEEEETKTKEIKVDKPDDDNTFEVGI
tara:strand:- start:545 stop:1252 length:708 start_codon:yes stop_codon:yes gene_type:complete